MSAADKQVSDDADARRILLVGDPRRAFLDSHAAAEASCQVLSNLPDAIDAAGKNRFAAIAIVMHGISARLSSALKALRDRSDARIILLAQMYEEPIAIQLVGSPYNGSSLADNYLICPVRADNICEAVTVAHARPKPAAAPSAEPETTTEARIRHLERLATEDDLTGLKNRRYIMEFSRQIIEHARDENGQVTVLVFDIDNFKHYNDVYGHGAGDEILKQAAVLMRRCCRAHDVVGRVGGDEFAVVFWDDPRSPRQRPQDRDRKTEDRHPASSLGPAASDRRSTSAGHPTEAVFIAKRFVEELEKAELSTLGGLGPAGKGVLTISGGLASFPRDGRTNVELFQQADKALLEAKRSGKNRIYLVGTPNGDISDIN
ncbi:MAG: GGDEF domain-containing protein [Planctomycetota bacterium]